MSDLSWNSWLLCCISCMSPIVPGGYRRGSLLNVLMHYWQILIILHRTQGWPVVLMIDPSLTEWFHVPIFLMYRGYRPRGQLRFHVQFFTQGWPGCPVIDILFIEWVICSYCTRGYRPRGQLRFYVQLYTLGWPGNCNSMDCPLREMMISMSHDYYCSRGI